MVEANAFDGYPRDAVTFRSGLEVENSRTYFGELKLDLSNDFVDPPDETVGIGAAMARACPSRKQFAIWSSAVVTASLLVRRFTLTVHSMSTAPIGSKRDRSR